MRLLAPAIVLGRQRLLLLVLLTCHASMLVDSDVYFSLSVAISTIVRPRSITR